MEQNLLKRIFTLDFKRDVNGNQGHFFHFYVDTEGDAIYALVDHYLEIFSISEFPLAKKEEIDAVYINQIDFEAGSGLLAIGGKNYSGSPPIKIFDTRKWEFKWIVSNFSENFIKKSRAVGRKIDARYKCQLISLPIRTVFNLKISPNRDYLLASCLGETEDSFSDSLKNFSLHGDLLAESQAVNTRVFSIHPEGRIIAAASGKTKIRVFNPSTSIRDEYKSEIEINRQHNADLLGIIKDITSQSIHVQNNVNAIAKAENSSKFYVRNI